jgi:hypothetical protein
MVVLQTVGLTFWTLKHLPKHSPEDEEEQEKEVEDSPADPEDIKMETVDAGIVQHSTHLKFDALDYHAQ